MRAAVLHEGTDQLVVEEIEHTPLGPREVRVATAACGLCHSDLHLIEGVIDRPRPHLLGHEAAGVVVEVGSGVTSVAIGEHVVTCIVQGCGECRRCADGEPALCTSPAATRRAAGEPARLQTLSGATITGFANVGGLTEQMVLDERALTPIDDDVPLDLASILGCAVVTGLGAVFNVAKVTPGDTVAVLGCGGVGLNVVQAARIAGAAQVIAVDTAPAKLEAALAMGATHAVDAGQGDAVAAVRGLSDGGVDHAFEVIGRPATAQQALAMAANGRTAYVVGVMADEAVIAVPAEATKRGKSVRGVYMGSTNPRVDIPRYVELWRRGQLDLGSMVNRRLTLDEVNDGFRALAAGEVNRAVVVFGEQGGTT
jgi:S-(hydroxymethyl)glutathione dehydrogenase/alcohol dehydrogenase